MKILFLSAWFPYPPDNGSRIRVYNLMKALARKHEVFLVSLLQDDSRRDSAGRLADICEVVSLHEAHWFRPGTWKSMLGFFSSRPRVAVDTFDPAVLRAVEDAIDRIRPDVLVASTLGVVEYVPNRLGIPALLEEHNCEYAVVKRNAEKMPNEFKRLRYMLASRKFARWEARMCRKFSAIAMVSEQDRDQILEAAPDLDNVRVIPNGVDVDLYNPAAWLPDKSKLLYNGALTYSANLDAVRHYAADIYPILRDTCPDAKLRVTGRTTGVDLRGIEECPGVQLTGYVDDIRDVLATSAACVVPLRAGGGTRLKILEAMAAGVPVVSTSMGAEGIGAVSGTHLLLADTPAEFAQAVRRVLEDRALAAELSANARLFVEELYSWSRIGEEFTRLVESVAKARGSEVATERIVT